VKTLKWHQVNAWRLSQHNLTHRLSAGDLIQAVRQSMGVHAQNMLAAELAIGARVDELSPQDVQAALWQDRTLIKTWMMRQTLHLIPAVDFPTYIAARRSTDINWPSIFDKQGIDRATLDAYLAASSEILDSGPLTRQQFVEAVYGRLKSPELREFLSHGTWGTAFKPLAWRGELCFGPNDGSNTTFIRPSTWLGGWQEIDPEAAMRKIVHQYLMVYGPARPRHFQVWWWMSGAAAKRAFDSIADEIEVVDVEGWRSNALKATIEPMREMEPSGKVNLLPAFDAYTIGLARGKDLERLIPLDWQKKVYRQQGWVSAVILVDGFIKGTWEHKTKKTKTTITVDVFSPVTHQVKEELAAEAERLGKFLDTNAELEFSQC